MDSHARLLDACVRRVERTRLWVRRFDGRSNADDVANGIAASPDGSLVFVTGTSRHIHAGQAARSDELTIAYGA